MSKVKKTKQSKEESEIDVDVENEEDYDIDSDIDESIYDEDLEDDIEEINDEVDDSEPNDCIMEKIMEDNYNTLIEDDIKKENTHILLEKNDRISPNRLTKYEMVRILGERTKQLTLGAKPLIKNYQSLSYEQIAEEELKLNMTPYKIKRTLPNKKYEIWSLDELKKDHLLSYLY
jgi:DNA-directed RNA polymerase subunit K/omega